MSTTPEADFDLEKLFLPAWAQESPAVNRYAKYTGGEEPDRSRKFDDRRPRGPRRDGGGPGAQGGRPPRRDGPGMGGPRRDGGSPQRFGGPAAPGGPRPQGGSRGPRRDDRGGDRRGTPQERREPMLPLPDLNLSFLPDDKGVESLSRQIKMSGRSFPLFDIAQMILQKPERHLVRFETRPKSEGQHAQELFLCAIDDTLWLSVDEAVSHVLDRHFGMFYQAEKTPTDPPKGVYTFVAQCGMSGVVLGPPNYHAYQDRLRKLHTERFSRMPFEAFKARVRIVKDEAVVKKWVEEQSVKTEYVCLNVPEPLRLANREDVEKHFREVHLASIIKPVAKHTLTGAATRGLRSQGLSRLVRVAWEDQKRFPLQIATVLSQQFASHGLQFFKVNKTVTHVSVARPHFLDLDATPVSEQVRLIVKFIDATPRCNRRKLIETLAPTPPRPTVISVTPTEAPAPAVEASAAPEAPAAETTPADASAGDTAPTVPATPVKSAAPARPAEAEPTPEQAAIIGDLHWLIHQGHVIEFANGLLENAKKPIIKPPRAPRPEAKPAGATAETAPTSAEAPPATTEAQTAPIEPGAEPGLPMDIAPIDPPAPQTAAGEPVAAAVEPAALAPAPAVDPATPA